ncbi:MAG: hypothetical protein V3V29_02090 [Acidimicrobiia bacterium]
MRRAVKLFFVLALVTAALPVMVARLTRRDQRERFSRSCTTEAA